MESVMHITTAQRARPAPSPQPPQASTSSPTFESYGALDEAFSFFNERLFDAALPPCLLTLHRHRRAYGYFAPRRFEHAAGGAWMDEIALNPDYFKHRTDAQTLSTLVHEMAHLWQQHFGKPSRNGYHNKEWGSKMDELGLSPSSTGQPGGKRTGQSVSHYIVEGGPYARSAAELLATGLVITWRAIPNGTARSKHSGRRAKYSCTPTCKNKAQVWGKAGLNIICGTCERRMDVELNEGEEADD